MMRRMIICLLVFCIASFSYAQHFRFMGVEINGAAASFESRLKKKGFETEYMELFFERVPVCLRGRYEGYNVAVYYECTPKSELVFAVQLQFTDSGEESAKKRVFGNVCRLIEKKYPQYRKDIESSSIVNYYVTDGYEGKVRVDMSEEKVYVTFYDQKNSLLYIEEDE